MPATIAEVLDEVLASDPDREALVCRHGRCSYGDLDRLANRAAHTLAAFGVRPGERIAASLPNDLDILVAFHGAMRLGAVWVGVNRALAPPEKAFILHDASVSLLLCDPPTAAEVAPLRNGLPELARVVVIEAGDPGEWSVATDVADDGRPDALIDPFAPAGIAYTSGTTGRPKGAVHSQYNLLLPGAATVARRGYGPDLRKGDCLPLTILNMMVLTTLLVAQAGGTTVIMDRLDAAGVAEWIRAERVTTWNGPPALLYSLAADPGIRAEALATLTEVWSGGGDLPEVVRDRFEARFARRVVGTFGLTEAPTLVTIEDRERPHVPGSSGQALPHLSVRILGDDGRQAQAGETGEIWVGPVADGPWAGAYRPMLGYWGGDAATQETIQGGGLRTGDLGYVNGEGHLFVRDRKSLLIIRGGANVYPAEVERVLAGFTGVVASAVVGIPDPRLGERVVAAVQLEPAAAVSEAGLSDWCRANLARYKVPERFIFVDGFPRNSMGKILRPQVSDLVAAQVGPRPNEGP